MPLTRQGSFMPKLLARRQTRAASKIQAAWRRRKARKAVKPSRLYSGKKTYSQTRRITNAVMANIAESKYQGARKDCLDTVAKPLGTIRPMSYIFLNTGVDISAQHPEFQTPLNLFTFPKGTDGDKRVGEYMYVKKSHIKLNIQCLPIGFSGSENEDVSLNAPIDCRLMVVKANRKNNKYGTSPSPAGSLFIDTQNGQFGYNETTGSINLLMSQPINKRKFIVYRDYKFTLAPPAIEHIDLNGTLNHGTTYANSRYPSRRNFSMNLPIFKKTHFDDSSNTPDDIDTQWFIILQCVRQTHCFLSGPSALRPSNIRMELLGTTSALDN